jgi:hypothetical protein
VSQGFAGADLANVVNEAALLAARRGKGVHPLSAHLRAKAPCHIAPEVLRIIIYGDGFIPSRPLTLTFEDESVFAHGHAPPPCDLSADREGRLGMRAADSVELEELLEAVDRSRFGVGGETPMGGRLRRFIAKGLRERRGDDDAAQQYGRDGIAQ